MNFATATAAVTFLATTIGTLYGGATWIDGKYAHQSDLELVEMRVDQKIQGDQLNRIQERKWKLQEVYGEHVEKAPATVREEYLKLKDDEAQKQYRMREIERDITERAYQRAEHPEVGK